MIKFFGNQLPKDRCNRTANRAIDVGMSEIEHVSAAIKSLDAIAKSVGKTFMDTVNVRQGHTATAVYAYKFDFLSRVADGIVTTNPDLLLCIRTADCAPVLFQDKRNGVIGAAHAGWRGALSGILENTVRLMLEYGARTGDIRAFIGPLLVQGSFECKDNMRTSFINQDKNFARFFEIGDDTTIHFDFPNFVKYKLESSGISNITWGDIYKARNQNPIDTYNSPEYHSYRRAQHQMISDTGRNCSVISI
ncbi:MAG: polyphenol oxidase family protein [Alphaproteobacteria bacterium]|nr:polyphenol oxidase family protein [Alphaproteobacteria bacterium]